MKVVAVLGAGAWGTTFANILADAGENVNLWARNSLTAQQMQSDRTSSYLPGAKLEDSVTVTSNMVGAVDGADAVFVAIPSDVCAQALAPLRGAISDDTPVASLTKGLRGEQFATDVIREALDLRSEQVCAISGPNLAREIVYKQPAATVVACENEDVAKFVGTICDAGYFRPYYSTDMIGVEVAGVTKNVIALAVGAASGMGFGNNTQSTLLTRGLAEMTRLGVALGASAETFLGLAGIGDLSATCASKLSRNFTFGSNIGRGMSVSQALEVSQGTVEGMKSCRAVAQLASAKGVEMPITESVVDVIYHGLTAPQMGAKLLGRPRKRDGVQIEMI